jgi:HEPN domain-containing protein
MSDENDPLVWVQYAEGDYDSARALLRRKRIARHVVCFLAQQSAEKYLKALLVAKGAQYPRIHDLDQLSRLCEKAGVLISIDADRLNALSVAAVQTRYPGDPITMEEMREAFETAKAVRKFARKYLGVP